MKVIFLSEFMPTVNHAGGGLQHYIARMALALHHLGDEIWVICKSKNANYEQYPYQIVEIQLTNKEKKLLSCIQIITFHKIDYALMLVFNAWATRRECKKIRGVDIIQSPNYQSIGLFIKSGHARLVVRASSYRPLWSRTKGVKITPENKFTGFLERRLYKRADAVFAPSMHLATILESEVGRSIDVLPSPMPGNEVDENLDWYEQNLAGRKYLLYFGDMIKRKGIFVLAHALNEVWKTAPEVYLIMAGPEKVVNGRSMIAKFFDIVKPNEDKILYVGELDRPTLFPVIKNSWFVVLPSIEDNCPNTMLEAMSLGKVVLGTLGSSMDEFYPASCSGLLVPRNDIQRLAEKILELWGSSKNQLDVYGRQCKLFIEDRHTLSKAALSLHNYYVQQMASH